MKHRNPALAPGFLLPGKTFVRTCPALPAKATVVRLFLGQLANPQAPAGAEIAVGLYERWAARRLGVCELPEEQSDDRGPH